MSQVRSGVFEIESRVQEMRKFLLFIVSMIFGGCVGIPEGITPVGDFDLNRYLGKWYEMARLDHSFERGMDRVTAEYSIRDDGGVKVLNRGFLTSENRWKEAEGRAYFVRSENEGYLKVSFFGPFYGSYVIFELDSEEYQYAFVTSSNRSYLWLLSREPVISEDLKQRFLTSAEELGFDVEELIFVEHDIPDEADPGV